MTALTVCEARIGDRVVNGSVKGVIAGVSNENDCVIVLWTCVPGVDVIGVRSPVWMHYDVIRDEPETFETVYDGHQPNSEPPAAYPVYEVAAFDINQVQTIDMQRVPKLPWSE